MGEEADAMDAWEMCEAGAEFSDNWARDKCKHDYKEISSIYDADGESYECTKCGDRSRLYYEDMA